jgi:uncharacterized protein YjcR
VQPHNEMSQKGGRPPIEDETREAIRKQFAKGDVTREELAAKYGISYNTVRNILKEKPAA